MSWIQQKDSDCIIAVRVTPRASQNRVENVVDDCLRIRLQSPPVEGKANRTLIKFLGKRLGLSASRIQLISGEKSRMKRILVTDCTADAVRAKLGVSDG